MPYACCLTEHASSSAQEAQAAAVDWSLRVQAKARMALGDILVAAPGGSGTNESAQHKTAAHASRRCRRGDSATADVAVDCLTRSLFERVCQLEKQNRALQRKVKRLTEAVSIHERVAEQAQPSHASLNVQRHVGSISCDRPQPAAAPGQLSLPCISGSVAAPQLSELPQQQEAAAGQQTIAALQRQVGRVQALHGLLQRDYSDLEAVLQHSERQRREYATRYAFVVLDQDNDGYISAQQVEGYELFASYPRGLLSAAFSQWHWQSGFPGFFTIDDFVRFVSFAEDRSSREAQRFWFSVLDADGDGRLGWADMRQAYDAVDKSRCSFVVSFGDLVHQISDMVGAAAPPRAGFTASELWRSKLGAGVLGLLINHNNMLLQRSTAEWGRGDYLL